MRTMFRILVLLFLMAPVANIFGCTVFTASNGNRTLVGNNEDMFDSKSKAEFYTPADGKYGRVFFGFGRNPHQGGMNEKGLFFDCVATGPPAETRSKTKPECPGGLLDRMMEDCATVQQALGLFDKYDITFMNSYKTIVVDASGAGFVTQGGIIDRKEAAFFAVGRGETVASRRLEEAPELSVDLFRSIASDAHVEGVVRTLYSNVYDLKSQVVYLYYYYDFDNPLRIDLHDYLKEKGTCTYYLGYLFPERQAQIRNGCKMVSRDKWKSAAELDPASFSRYIGTYFGEGIDIDVTRVNDRYEIRFMGTEPYELVPLSQRAFAVIDAENSSRIEFVKDSGGESFHLVADLDGWKFKAERRSN